MVILTMIHELEAHATFVYAIAIMDDQYTYNPMDENVLRVTPELLIPRAELQFRTSRSGGPGGQHVNKVETKVELLWDVANSPSLTEEQRERLLAGLKTWLDSDGELHVVSEHYRSQYRNREDVLARFILLLQGALRPRIPRKPTRTPRRAKEARLQDKRQRSEIKRRRSGREE